MHVKISSRWLEYEFDIYNKYTILQGDSGTGKTTLCDLIAEYIGGNYGVQVQSNLEVHLCNEERAEAIAKMGRLSKALIVIDEFYTILHQHDIASLLRDSDNYFLIVTRDVSKLDYLPLSVENVLEVRSSGRYHTLCPMYPLHNKRIFKVPDIIITEDSRSNYQFFKEFYPELECVSAGSKSQIADLVMEYKGKHILVVYDSAAFGSNITELAKVVYSLGEYVQILDWYSFEWYILSQKGFDINIDPKDLGCNIESLEQYATEYLESRCKYSKSKIHPCVAKVTMCPSCRDIDCVLRHNVIVPDLRFRDSQETSFFGGE